VVLETVAAVPGMVVGMLRHMRSLRRVEDDRATIRIRLDEAENERMHLMTFWKLPSPVASSASSFCWLKVFFSPAF
jgi:ubiquinol oxidase